jgi:hypothetical protein
MTDPVTQFLTDSVQFVRTTRLGAALAIALGGYWLYVLWSRATSSTDPSLRKQSETALGAMSTLISGVYVSAMVAGLIAYVTWPAVAENLGLALLLLGGVTFHAILELNEKRGGEPLLGGG